MMVIVLENVPASLRGELTRWLIEPHAGVFIGHVSALVRERLWIKCCANKRAGGVIQAWSTNTEQHFQIRMYGNTDRAVIDLEGFQLIRIPETSEKRSEPDAREVDRRSV